MMGELRQTVNTNSQLMNLGHWIKDFNILNLAKPHNIWKQKHIHYNATGTLKRRFLNVENKVSMKILFCYRLFSKKIGSYVVCSFPLFFSFRTKNERASCRTKFYFFFILVAYLSSYHEKAINALYELA